MKSIVSKVFILIFISIGFIASSFAQNSQFVQSINWVSDSVLNQKVNNQNTDLSFPRYKPEKFGSLPSVYLKLPANAKNNAVRVQIKSVSDVLISDINDFDKIKDDIQLTYHTVLENHQPYLLINFLPIIKTVNGLKKVNEYTLEINPIQADAKPVNNLRVYSQNSVLANGNWYKIAVKDQGVYKLSFDFIKNMGIDVNNLNPKNIRIYGNGGDMLPQANSENRIDDLQENAIEVVGEADGKFDNSDYILFYAKGNAKWNLSNNGTYFEHQSNIYSDSSYYYINIDKGLGKRISTIPNSNLTANYITSYYDDHQFYEKDLYTLITSSIKSGRNWYGEDFEFNASRNFDFDISGIQNNSPSYIKTNMVIRANVNSLASVKVNNQPLYNLSASSLTLNFEADFARPVSAFSAINNLTGNTATVNVNYSKPNAAGNAWLDFIELNCRRQLNLNNYLSFRDISSVSNNNISQFNIISSALDAKIWDVTNPLSPNNHNFNRVGNTLSFTTTTSILKEFIAFTSSAFKEATAIGRLATQNLHALNSSNLIIITAPQFFAEAKRLAEFRKAQQNISFQIVTPQQVYNEFSSGKADATAIRDFVKMFYDRANGNPNNTIKYLLIFGKGSFDNRKIKFKENNFVVTYQSDNSLSPTESYTSDDYFALLDDDEGTFPEDYVNNPGLLDLAVGRIPVKTLEEAKNVVDKLINYAGVKSFGDWRNQIAIIADDEDNNLHLNQAEANADVVAQRNPNINIDKIYFDAYQQGSVAGGNRYPEVEDAINQKVNNGSLLINYTGHGGESGWAAERVLTLEDIVKWKNPNNLPIIFTATCSFSRWDDPETISGGELALLEKENGVPSIFSTTRIVFASYNFDLNQSFLRALFEPANINKAISFGDVFRAAKNNNIGGLNINSRNFTLLGDPTALFPIPINQIISNVVTDTLKAGKKVNMRGYLSDNQGKKLINFNGFVYPTVFDKPSSITTLAQDRQNNGSYAQTFQNQKNIIYKGKVSVTNGEFSFDFIVPKDINLQLGRGKISYYANNQIIDAAGFQNIWVGGTTISSQSDKIGPIIKAYLNDEKFVSGGITNTNPILLVNLKDESGINTTGIGIGHDIVATLTGQVGNEKSVILNQFYQANLDSYQEGLITYSFNGLSPGFYSLKIKAWDVFNNSSEETITFEVKETESLALAHVLNYPNPFTTHTNFQFEHNHPNEDLEVQVNIKTVSGRLIKTINQLVNSKGNRVNDISWDGKDDFGEKLARGIYIYELKVRSTVSGQTMQKIQKLVLL